jgi:hypothetical protein
MKPNYTLHKVNNEFLVTSDEEIKEGDIICHFDLNKKPGLVTKCTSILNLGLRHKETVKYIELYQPIGQYKTVISQQPNIDFTLLKEDECKRIGWWDVDSYANSEYELQQISFEDSTDMFPFNDAALLKAGFIDGFQKALSLLSDRRFTESDMVDFAMYHNNYSDNYHAEENFKDWAADRPTSWGIEGGMEGDKFKITALK